MTRIPTPTLRGLAALLFAVGIVTAAAGSGAFGPGVRESLDEASPVSEAEACGGLCVGTALVIGSFALGAVAGSQLDGDGVSREKVQKIKSVEALQQKLDLHALGISAREFGEKARTTVDNFLVDSRSIASMEAKSAALKLLNNGTKNATKVRNAMHTAIEDYYAVRERNLAQSWSKQAAQLGYVIDTSINDSDISAKFVRPDQISTEDRNGGDYSSTSWSWQSNVTRNVSYTLVNGDSVTITALGIEAHAVGNQGLSTAEYTNLTLVQRPRGASNSDAAISFSGPLVVESVSGSNESTTVSRSEVVNWTKYQNRVDSFSSQVDQMEANYNLSFAQNLVAGYKSGTLNSSDIVTPEMLARDFSTSYNETGASIYQWASLASMGLDSPDLANTSYMEVNYYKSTSVRYVTLTANGTPSAPTPYNISVGGEVVGQLFEDANDTSARVPIPVDVNDSKIGDQPPTVNIATYGGLSTAWESQEVDAGETLQVEGVNITASKPGRYKRVTEKGMLFARNAPNGTWEVGETYNASTNPGTEFFAPAGKYTRVTRMSGNFTIEQIVTDSGSTVTNLSTRDYNYQTSNASEFVSQLQSLEDVRKDAESREPTVGGGSGGGGNQSPYILVALFALGAALLYYNRGDTDG